jgi:hypothetical protein
MKTYETCQPIGQRDWRERAGYAAFAAGLLGFLGLGTACVSSTIRDTGCRFPDVRTLSAVIVGGPSLKPLDAWCLVTLPRVSPP